MLEAENGQVAVGDATAQKIWDRIYSVTSFFVGTADDLTLYEYLDALEKVFGTDLDSGLLVNAEEIDELWTGRLMAIDKVSGKD